MKHLKLTLLAVLSVCCGAPPGFRTANAAAADADLQKKVAAQDERIKQLESQLAQRSEAAPAENSTLTLLCKGAEVDPDDVRWRVAAGLDLDQAVQAAVFQKASDAEAKKGGQ